jgi:CRISPR-associated exonuclease Cas4
LASWSSEGPASLTVTDVMEYLFCPRFIYFLHCLEIPQHEEKRSKVRIGREAHHARETTNISYLRHDLGVQRKEAGVYLTSEHLPVRGIVDEVLFLDDGTAAPLDYKFAEDKDTLFRTHRFQSVLYGMMIEERYEVPVKRGYLCYLRSNNAVREVPITPKARADAESVVDAILEITEYGYYPRAAASRRRCIDCCYRHLCDR